MDIKNVLVVAAHPDDEILGVGGTVRKLANEGKTVRALILAEGLTSRADKREDVNKSELEMLRTESEKAAGIIGYESIDFCGFPDNRMDSLELLDIIKLVNSYIEKYSPDTIFTHHYGDLNIDHRITCEVVLTACRPVPDCYVKQIYAFETLSSTEWDFNYNKPFTPNEFWNIAETFDKKIEAMKCYSTELNKYPHPRSIEGIEALAKYRGCNVGVLYAEAFCLLRRIVF